MTDHATSANGCANGLAISGVFWAIVLILALVFFTHRAKADTFSFDTVTDHVEGPSRVFQTQSRAYLAGYCRTYRGILVEGGNACAIQPYRLSHFDYPCTEVFLSGLAPSSRRESEYSANAVCNGWRPW